MSAPVQLLLAATPLPTAPVTGMRAWYRGDTVTLSGSTVTAWPDKSGNAFTMSQVTLARDPAYTATDANFNNQPSLQGTNAAGTTLRAASALSSFVSASAYTIYGVLRPTGYGSSDGSPPSTQWKTYLGDRNSVLSLGIGSSKALADNFDGADQITGGAVSLNTTYGIEVSLNSGTLSHRVSGASATTIASGNLSALGGVFEVFYGDGSLSYDGYAAEFIVYNTALSAANQQTNRDYITGRYGIAW